MSRKTSPIAFLAIVSLWAAPLHGEAVSETFGPARMGIVTRGKNRVSIQKR